MGQFVDIKAASVGMDWQDGSGIKLRGSVGGTVRRHKVVWRFGRRCLHWAAPSALGGGVCLGRRRLRSI